MSRHVAGVRSRLADCHAALLHAYALLSVSYPRKEKAEWLLAEWGGEREGLKEDRHRLAGKAQASRASWRTEQEQAHARELEVNDLRHRRDSLCARLQEDYQLDLAALYEQMPPTARWRLISRKRPRVNRPTAPISRRRRPQRRRSRNSSGS